MKTSLHWLNSYLDRPVDAEEAERVLTDIGFPLEEQVPVGEDVMLDVEVTSNRPDVLCHVGVAREIAAATGRDLILPDIALPASDPTPITDLTSVDNQVHDLCPMYTARLIRGVRVGPSPDWLRQRIEAVGMRPVNNIVDITNYVLYELAQPLHAFDFNLLAGRRIVVRRATEGETFHAIDATRHTLRSDMMVIADAERPVAVAGVMGGLDTEVSAATTDVLLEAARFGPLSIRSTSRALKLSSDSSYVFERGINPEGVDLASRRACQLICELAGGTLVEGVIAAGVPHPAPHRVTMRPARCNALLGYTTPIDDMLDRLARLGLAPVVEGDLIACTIPPHRLDLEREVDLIEEIARLIGMDHLEIQDDLHLTIRPPQTEVLAKRAVTDALLAHGYCETVTFSNLPAEHATPFLDSGMSLITLDEEKKKAEPALRPSVLPSLLAVRKHNQDLGNHDVRLFEIAQVFALKGGGLDTCEPATELALLADAPDASLALRQMTGVISEIAQRTGLDITLDKPSADLHPTWAGPAAFIMHRDDTGNRIVGIAALAAPDILNLFDLQTPVALAWLDYPTLVSPYPPRPAVAELPRFPAIERDLSIIVDEATPYADIDRAIHAASPALLERVEFLGTYRGKQIGPGRKSVSFRMLFRDPDKTLRHEEVDPQVAAVVASLQQHAHAELRG
jgi:phenylalanyl-tRNA synthetase beta chain